MQACVATLHCFGIDLPDEDIEAAKKAATALGKQDEFGHLLSAREYILLPKNQRMDRMALLEGAENVPEKIGLMKAEEVIQKLDESGAYRGKIVTEVTKASEFYIAEDKHQDFYARNPNYGYCAAVVRPKVEKFKKRSIITEGNVQAQRGYLFYSGPFIANGDCVLHIFKAEVILHFSCLIWFTHITSESQGWFTSYCIDRSKFILEDQSTVTIARGVNAELINRTSIHKDLTGKRLRDS